MLAYDENDKLCEFEQASSIAVCDKCHRLYRSSISEQTPGHREREYDNCPYCGYENDSSMSYDYCNAKLSKEELKVLKRKSLFGVIVNYCHTQYTTTRCDSCSHTSSCPGTSGGNCKQCLKQVHYPNSYPSGRKDYDCERMLYFYVCDYSAKYASEMLYLMRKSEALKKIEEYRVISIGCGACPDLMALERFCHESSPEKKIKYLGIDVNERWKNIHGQIENYQTTTIQKPQFRYFDAVTTDFPINHANVIVLQYVISHFYNTNQIREIHKFFQKLIENVISQKQKGVPMVILINDVNSNNRGRDYFIHLVNKLKKTKFHGYSPRYYFNHKIQNIHQQYGKCHSLNQILFDLPCEFDEIYQPWRACSSAQLLIEVYEEVTT